MARKISNHKYQILIVLVIILAIFFRLWHINFGLPHDLYADEPEIGEFATKYAFELKDIFLNNNYYKLIPVNFVYGTFPVYFFTAAVLVFSKIINNSFISFSSLYIFMRTVNALLSIIIIPAAAILFYKLFKSRLGAFFTFFLLALNWKLIVHAHYLNVDIIITILLTLAYLTAYFYYKKPRDSLYTWITGILIGLAVGTKVTAALTIPLFLYLYIIKKDFRGALGLALIAFLTFEITNPFSIIFLNEFSFRILSMLTKEGGIVFDSVDYSPLKYLSSLSYMVTPLIFISFVYGIYLGIKSKIDRPIHIFLIGNIIFYLVFYTLQSRRVDRWLLPIIPLTIIYASYGIIRFKEIIKNKWVFPALILAILFSYMYFPIKLLYEFRRYTPKSEAYLWVRDNVPENSTKLTVTEEGLDPMNKATNSTVLVYEVYGYKNAQLGYPPNPFLYDYVILSSRPMMNFKRKQVVETYPLYAKAWQNFENTITKSDKFSLVKSFSLPKPNLIPLSDVTIYKQIY